MKDFNQIDLTMNEAKRQNAVKRAKEQNIIIPTFEQMKHPELIPDEIKAQLKNLDPWALDPLNLFRITWQNESLEEGGLFSDGHYFVLPKELSGVDAKIVCLSGKYFPTGAHKVGAAFGCLVPRLITGQFDPTTTKAVWPSTGNYCRGGAYDSALLACESIAILPEGMSQERFDWLKKVAGEVIPTPGTESNVKEIFDKCWDLRNSGEDLMIFNQFDEFGNYLWHYDITGDYIERIVKKIGGKYKAYVSATGSGGTIAAGDYLKKIWPTSKVIAAEALQCPTIYENGFGEHRIEGIGDKHIPWIHNVKNTDAVVALDDEIPMNMIRLFNEPAGKKLLLDLGVDQDTIDKLQWAGISGAANIANAIKTAKYFEMKEDDIIVTVLTDSMDMYESRLKEMTELQGEFTELEAYRVYHQYLLGLNTDYFKELNYRERKAVHNLKYYTWVEQQGKTYEEICAQWDHEEYWESIPKKLKALDKLIVEFNKDVKALK